MVKWLSLGKDVKIEICESPLKLRQLKSFVEKNWQAETAHKDRVLFKGPVFSVLDVQHNKIKVFQTDYSYLRASRKKPDMGLCPLAVTGVSICLDGVILGRRGGQTANERNMWEFAPAGGLAQHSPQVQVLEELQEELGVRASEVSEPEILGLVIDEADDTYDIVMRLNIALTKDQIMRRFKSNGCEEYSEIKIVPQAELLAFYEGNSQECIPIFPQIFEQAGLQKE